MGNTQARIVTSDTILHGSKLHHPLTPISTRHDNSKQTSYVYDLTFYLNI